VFAASRRLVDFPATREDVYLHAASMPRKTEIKTVHPGRTFQFLARGIHTAKSQTSKPPIQGGLFNFFNLHTAN
jgi:hypothetical protein